MIISIHGTTELIRELVFQSPSVYLRKEDTTSPKDGQLTFSDFLWPVYFTIQNIVPMFKLSVQKFNQLVPQYGCNILKYK